NALLKLLKGHADHGGRPRTPAPAAQLRSRGRPVRTTARPTPGTGGCRPTFGLAKKVGRDPNEKGQKPEYSPLCSGPCVIDRAIVPLLDPPFCPGRGSSLAVGRPIAQRGGKHRAGCPWGPEEGKSAQTECGLFVRLPWGGRSLAFFRVG